MQVYAYAYSQARWLTKPSPLFKLAKGASQTELNSLRDRAATSQAELSSFPPLLSTTLLYDRLGLGGELAN